MPIPGNRMNILEKFLTQSGLRKSFKSLFSKVLFANDSPVIVASSGRSGSTMLFRSIQTSYFTHKSNSLYFNLAGRIIPSKYLLRLSELYLDSFADFPRFYAPIQKTHVLCDYNYTRSARCIFVFGDPLESALSVYQQSQLKGPQWAAKHLCHLQSNSSIDALFQQDALNYEQQLKSWMHPDVFYLHYLDIWKYKNELSRFLGFTLILPPQLNRTPKAFVNLPQVNEELFSYLRNLESIARDQSHDNIRALLDSLAE